MIEKKKGLFAGISSGANVYAAVQTAKKLKKGQTVVTVLPDSQDRYTSLGIFTTKTAKKVYSALLRQTFTQKWNTLTQAEASKIESQNT